MNIVKAEAFIEDKVDGEEIIKKLERAGRTCYKSEACIDMGTGEKFIKAIIKKGHHTILEHHSVSVRFICDRGISHEAVRHRIASFSQESTRYCNYNKDKFGGEITIIMPSFFSQFWNEKENRVMSLTERSEASLNASHHVQFQWWLTACKGSENAYMSMLAEGSTPQEARSVLPNSLKTEFVMTANLREWRHFFNLRAAGTTGTPHPQMLEIAIPLLKEFQSRIPIIFDDIEVK